MSQSFSQYIAFEPIDEAGITDWQVEASLSEYMGIYQFGLSEDESSLILFETGEEVIAQIQSGSWNEGATAWIWTYDNLENVSIDTAGNFEQNSTLGSLSILMMEIGKDNV